MDNSICAALFLTISALFYTNTFDYFIFQKNGSFTIIAILLNNAISLQG